MMVIPTHGRARLLLLLLTLALTSGHAPSPAHHNAATPPCSQASFDGPSLASAHGNKTFTSLPPMRGFYQWWSNQGYCGESSLIQSALGHGQWISQFNIRSLTSPASDKQTQTEAPDWTVPVFQSQLLLGDSSEYSDPNGNNFGAAATAFGLVVKAFPSASQATGLKGYRSFMLWLKAELMAGHHVTAGVIEAIALEPPYTHIVNVVRIDVADPGAGPAAYNDADVLYVDDHGGNTCVDTKYPCQPADNTAVPPGAAPAQPGCTPFVFGYSMAQWRRTPVAGKQSYGFIVPSSDYKNYAYSISGVADTDNVTLPVSLSMTTALPFHPVAGYQYEAPFIGNSVSGSSSTNRPPVPMHLNLTVTVSRLVPGRSYILYRYQWQDRPLRAPLDIPADSFNENSDQASSATQFTAGATTYSSSVTTLSSYTEVFRCVPADAP